MRVRKKDQVKDGEARLNPAVAEELGVSSVLEVVIAGKRKMLLAAKSGDEVPPGEVWASPEDMERAGVADNSIATIRSPQQP